jgi:hypothetical protein
MDTALPPRCQPLAGGDLSRREFLGTCAAGTVARLGHVTVADPSHQESEHAVILLLLLGGPGAQETFDPKPDAPAETRGPFRAIATRLPGVFLSESFPLLAQRLDRVSLVRTVYHESAPIHETGLQLLQTGRLIRGDTNGYIEKRPGSVWDSAAAPGFSLLPGGLGSTGVAVSRGQDLGALGQACLPRAAMPDGSATDQRSSEPRIADSLLDLSGERREVREAYGSNRFGRDCLRARRLVEAGSRLVVVNMFSTVFDSPSWDCHGRRPFARFEDYRETVCPMFDQAFSALLDDLASRGRLVRTLVVAAGEFGRSPMLNDSGGRDHWTRASSAVLAGGPAPTGLVLGATDRWGGEPVDSPVDVRALHATMAYHLGQGSSHAPLFG